MADKEEKPKKVYKLRKFKECSRCKKPLTSDKDEVCAPCGLALAQEKKAAQEGTSEGTPGKGPTSDPLAFSRTCAKCGAGLSSDKDSLCPVCRGAVDPEPMTLDMMKEVFAEIERQNTEDEKIAEEVKKRFSITDTGSANWAAGKIALWQNEIERRKTQTKEFIAEAERNVRRLKFLFMGQLEAWAKTNIPHDKKSIKLPLATLKFSDTQEKIEIVDEEKTVAWATVNCENAVKMVPELQVLKDLWLKSEKKTVPDGCKVVPKETNFKVE